jgi:hypothetical protein
LEQGEDYRPLKLDFQKKRTPGQADSLDSLEMQMQMQMWMGLEGEIMKIMELELNGYLNDYLPIELNRQKTLIFEVKNCKCIPFCRTYLGFHLLMELFWDFWQTRKKSHKSPGKSEMPLGLFWDHVKVPGS